LEFARPLGFDWALLRGGASLIRMLFVPELDLRHWFRSDSYARSEKKRYYSCPPHVSCEA
jgi:hypothetical protein